MAKGFLEKGSIKKARYYNIDGDECYGGKETIQNKQFVSTVYP